LEDSTLKKIIFITAGAVAVYTAVVVLCFFFFSPAALGKSSNDEWSARYRYIDYTDTQKAEIYSGLELDMAKLANGGFATYREEFMTPADWMKELHVINLSFENIYCHVQMFVHPDEIGWERGRTYIERTPTEIIGLQFERSTHGSLRLDDNGKGVIYTLECKAAPDDALFEEFLRLFFNKD